MGLYLGFAWELAYLGKKAGVITNYLAFPIAKGLISLGSNFHNKKDGKAIQGIEAKDISLMSALCQYRHCEL